MIFGLETGGTTIHDPSSEATLQIPGPTYDEVVESDIIDLGEIPMEELSDLTRPIILSGPPSDHLTVLNRDGETAQSSNAQSSHEQAVPESSDASLDARALMPTATAGSSPASETDAYAIRNKIIQLLTSSDPHQMSLDGRTRKVSGAKLRRFCHSPIITNAGIFLA